MLLSVSCLGLPAAVAAFQAAATG